MILDVNKPFGNNKNKLIWYKFYGNQGASTVSPYGRCQV